MFDNLPTVIKKMIFARVRLMDLYEVSGVSQEWWTLAMATYSRSCDKYSYFLTFQVQFWNEMMPKEGGWQKWMFSEFTLDHSFEFRGYLNDQMIEYLKRKGIHVRKLIIRTESAILRNLKQLFPQLQTLDLTTVLPRYDAKEVELPDGLKYIRLTIIDAYPGSHLMDAFKHLERLDNLRITHNQRIHLDNIRFDKLKKLYLNMTEQSTEDIKSLVSRSKQLSIVGLQYGFIDKEWLGLFPTNVQKIQLQSMRLDPAVLPLLGTTDTFVERQLMRFVCQDWTKIRLFKSLVWSKDRDYHHFYVCKPQLLEEELKIEMHTGQTPSGLFDSGKLQLKVLKLNQWRDIKRDFHLIVPKSVRQFEWNANQFEAFDFAVLFADISTITTLRIYSRLNEKIQFSEFPLAVKLVSLDISLVDDITLASILSNCPSLKQLSLKWPQGMPFSKLPADLQSSSLKQLTIYEPKDSISNILGHFPWLADLHLQYVNMESVTIADLAQLTSVEFVRISFMNDNDLVAFNMVANSLDQLSFSHLMMVYSHFDPLFRKGRLSCVIGREKAFFRRYLASNSKNDFTRMNIEHFRHWFSVGRLLYLKGVSGLHKSLWSTSIRITQDLQEFIAIASVEIQLEKKK